MEILSVGYDFRHDSLFALQRPNGMKSHLLLVIRSPARVIIRDTPQRVLPDSVIWISEGTPHGLYADAEAYINDWVEFTMTEAEYETYTSGMLLNTVYTTRDVPFLSDVVRLMQKESRTTGRFRKENMHSLLRLLLRKMQESSADSETEKGYYPLMQQLRNDIYEHPEVRYTVEALSAQMHLSKSYFQSLYRSYFRISPIADVIRSRISYAKQLLVSSGYSVAEIASLLGYQNDMQFIKQFKAVAHITPGKYRKQR